jgi:protease I
MAEEMNQSQELKGKLIAVLMTDGVEQIEYTSPRRFLEEHGAQVHLVSPKNAGEFIQGFNHMTPGEKFPVEKNVKEARPNDYDGLVLPGGVGNPDQLRLSPESIAFIREFSESDKPIAAICHGPWTLIDAGVALSKHMTSWPSLQADLRNAGAEWTDEEVVIDGRLITSRKPDDLPAFNKAMLQELMAGMGAEQDLGPSS